ncbi:hypothetical protein ACSNOI_40005 [Actinomadura kijaniata]|uniref:hypothetical protein n=1 Tax=Actinomadura kijaniata TaxID=46161 RepID=UPI003F1AAAA8
MSDYEHAAGLRYSYAPFGRLMMIAVSWPVTDLHHPTYRFVLQPDGKVDLVPFTADRPTAGQDEQDRTEADLAELQTVLDRLPVDQSPLPGITGYDQLPQRVVVGGAGPGRGRAGSSAIASTSSRRRWAASVGAMVGSVGASCCPGATASVGVVTLGLTIGPATTPAARMISSAVWSPES